jgi:lipoate-protein ligase A
VPAVSLGRLDDRLKTALDETFEASFVQAVRFENVEAPAETFDGEPPELEWLESAAQGRPRAVMWVGTTGLVAPTSYRRHANLDDVRASFAARGVPVHLRRSGGGVVPQGPGILNLSLVYAIDGRFGIQTTPAYTHLCAVLQRAFTALGIGTVAQEVPGSFCDGRYNLAVPGPTGARKVCGTAQYWRRSGKGHGVLSHALILIDANIEEITARANAFELALNTDRRYRAEVHTNVQREWLARHRLDAAPDDLEQRLRRYLHEAIVDFPRTVQRPSKRQDSRCARA